MLIPNKLDINKTIVIKQVPINIKFFIFILSFICFTILFPFTLFCIIRHITIPIITPNNKP